MVRRKQPRRFRHASSLCGAALLAVSLLAVPPALFAIGADTVSVWSAIDHWVEQRMQEERIPGVALAVVREGRVAYLRGYGIADAEGRPVTPRTPFSIGSVSKSFTGLAIAQLAEAGAVELDAPVSRYLPWFRTADAEASDAVTVRHLVTHTSGLSTLHGNRHRLRSTTAADALERRVRKLHRARLSAPPGTQFEYSNANYQILGALIEAVTGRSYEAHVAERIHRPLGMAAGFSSTPEWTPRNMAVGHRYWFGRPLAHPAPSVNRQEVAQAHVVASAEDMARYVLFQLGHTPETGASVLSPTGIETMHDPGSFNYGFGWRIGGRNGARLIGHTGANPGFSAFVMFAPGAEEGVVVLTNSADLAGRPGAPGIGFGVVDLLAGRVPQVPSRSRLGRIVITSAFLVLLVTVFSVVLTTRRLRQWRAGVRAAPTGWVPWLLRLVPTLAFLGAVAYVFLVLIWRNSGATIAAGLHFAPDIAWLSLLAGVAAIVWAVIRTALLARAFVGRGAVRPHRPA